MVVKFGSAPYVREEHREQGLWAEETGSDRRVVMICTRHQILLGLSTEER
jgi:hypothetical protein